MDSNKDNDNNESSSDREDNDDHKDPAVPPSSNQSLHSLPQESEDSESLTSASQALPNPAASIYGGNIAAACEATNAVTKTVSAEERLERRRTRNRLNARRNRENKRREEKLKEERDTLQQANDSLRRENAVLQEEVGQLREVIRQLTAASQPSWLSTVASVPPTFNPLNPLHNPLSNLPSFLSPQGAPQSVTNPLLAQSSIFHRMAASHGPRLLFPPVPLAEHQRLPSLSLNDTIQSSLAARYPPGSVSRIQQMQLPTTLATESADNVTSSSTSELLPPTRDIGDNPATAESDEKADDAANISGAASSPKRSKSSSKSRKSKSDRKESNR